MMINKRLVQMVDGSMRYVFRNVAAQWLGLCANIIAIIAIGLLLDGVLRGSAGASAMAITCAVVIACVAVRMAVCRPAYHGAAARHTALWRASA